MKIIKAEWDLALSVEENEIQVLPLFVKRYGIVFLQESPAELPCIMLGIKCEI